MRSPNRRPRLSVEHLLLLGALALFAVGSAWLAHDSCRARAEKTPAARSLALDLGLPLLHTLLRR